MIPMKNQKEILMKENKIVNFEDEIELKKMLDANGFRYGEIGCNDKYIIYFRDVKSGAPISQGIYDSPIIALRDLNVIVPQVKIPINEIMVQLFMCFNPSDGKKPMQFTDIVTLSPYLYFKKKEIVNNEVKENEENK